MFHVWMGPVRGGLAIGTIGLMVLVSAMNGLSVAGMATGATIALPELLRRGYDKRMVTGVVQAGIVARYPRTAVGGPGALCHDFAPAGRPALACGGAARSADGRHVHSLHCHPPLLSAVPRARRSRTTRVPCREPKKLKLLQAGILPLAIFAAMMIPFVNGWTSLVESSAIGAITAFAAAVLRGCMSREVLKNSTRQTLAISCMFMCILAALGFGAVFDGLGAVNAIDNLFTEQLGLNPWMILILMQISFLIMGTLSRRHGDAGHCRATLRAGWSRCSASISSGTACFTRSPPRSPI